MKEVYKLIKKIDFFIIYRLLYHNTLNMENDTQDIEDTVGFNAIPEGKIEKYIGLTKALIVEDFNNMDDVQKIIKRLAKTYRIMPNISQIRYVYHKFIMREAPISKQKLNILVKRSSRKNSGVLVVTVTTSPGAFSCPKNCHYCPNEVDENGIQTQPRAYLSKEPAMQRALRYNFEMVGQTHDRINAYFAQGNTGDFVENNPIIKLEIIVSGGTWSFYPDWYQISCVRDIYYASNIYGQETPRKPYFEEDKEKFLEQTRINYSVENGANIDVRKIDDDIVADLRRSLVAEIHENQTTMCRIIGLTLETRPDHITPTEIKKMLSYGVTRVQIGVQTTHDHILEIVNRESTTADTIKAIRLLKDAGLKVVIHLMPDLPGSSPELDIEMFRTVLTLDDLQFDDLKIYPTALTPFTDILKWYNKGTYIPYAEKNIEDLINVIQYYLERVPKYVRVQRIVRDIPATYLKEDDSDHYRGYGKQSHLRDIIEKRMEKIGKKSQDIRYMEVRNRTHLIPFAELTVIHYNGSNANEYFLSFETCSCRVEGRSCVGRDDPKQFLNIENETFFKGCPDRIAIFGFCRLRISKNMGHNNRGKLYIKEIADHAMVRELHIYGSSTSVGSNGISQHIGFGRKLMMEAEKISILKGYSHIAVSSGVGVREYYKNKLGYSLSGAYMTKQLIPEQDEEIITLSHDEPQQNLIAVTKTLTINTYNWAYLNTSRLTTYLKNTGWL
jgi:ELP3 family radical SAM enzyme/protein acetyltransferase